MAQESRRSQNVERSSDTHSGNNDITRAWDAQAPSGSAERQKFYFFGLASFFRKSSKLTLSSQTISVMFQVGCN
jgi:hypothetical protein